MKGERHAIGMERALGLCCLFLGVVLVDVVAPMHEETPEENRIDIYEDYFPHQDIHKSFQGATDYWLYGFNYYSKHTEGKQCVYLRKQSLTATQMNYTSNFIRNGTWGSIQYYGTFFSTIGISLENQPIQRAKYNSINVTTPEHPGLFLTYNLIYSNYENCSILRVPFMLKRTDTDLWKAYPNDAGSGCMVLLTDDVVEDGMPRSCQAIYNHSCGKYHKFYQIYNTSCTKNPDHKNEEQQE